ncbi:MAG: outer membrane lipoprotein-sorting protein [Sulfurimonas sp.]
MHFLLFFLLSLTLYANVDRTLPYPSKIDALEVAKQVYFVNHQFYLDNQILKASKRYSILIVRKSHKKKPRVLRANRYLNNDYDDGVIKSKDLVVFTSSQLKGTGVLAQEFVDESKSLEIRMWLPALRKVRRMAEPSKNMGYSAADVAFLEEAKLRRLSEDKYELLSTRIKSFEYARMKIKSSHLNKYTKQLPQDNKIIKTEVYVLKATPKENAWYDYRIDYIDTKTFTNYETKFYVDGEVIKIIQRDWKKVKGIKDKRAFMWTYWYSVNPVTKFETVNFIPNQIIKSNVKNVKKTFWSERTLSKIKK